MRRQTAAAAIVLVVALFGSAPAAYAAAPANDNFASAEVLTGNADSAAGTTVEATKEAGEPDHAGDSGGASIWYRWQAPSSGNATIELCDSDFDTLLAVYAGAAVSTLTQVAVNDDSCGGNQSLASFNATSGTVYRIAVDGFGGATGTVILNLTLIEPPAGPPNDNFADAEVLSGPADSAVGTTVHATKEAGEPNHAGNSGGVSIWYRWQAPYDGQVVIDTCDTVIDTLLAVYTGSPVSALTEVVSTSGGAECGGGASLVTFDAVAGTTYRIAIDGLDGWEGATRLHLQAGPPNDDFADAQVLSGASVTATGSNVGATMQPGEPNHLATNGAEASIWYRWTAPKIGQLTIDTCGSDIDTVLAVYTGSAVNALTRVAGNRDAEGTACFPQSRVSFETTAGTVYRIAVEGEWWAEEGDITLHVNLGPAFGYLEVPSSLDFGRIAVGKSVTKTLLLRNVGNGPLTISAVSLRKYPFASTEYTIAVDEATGSTIYPGGSRRVVLRFTPAGNASGNARPSSFFTVPSGFSLAKVTYAYDDLDNLIGGQIWHYFRNVGGTGSVSYRAAASNDYGNGFVVKGAKQGTATLRAGDYYAAGALSPYGIGSADRAAQEFFSPVGTSLSREEFTPLWPSYTVTALNGVQSVSVRRLGDALLLITSSDPTPQAPGAPYGFASDNDALTGVKILGESRAVCPGYADDPRNQIVGTARNNTLTGTTGRDIICGLGGNDVLRGYGAGDLLLGGPGDDTLYGGAGDDVLNGGLGKDRLYGETDDDKLYARDEMIDVVNGGLGSDTAYTDRSDIVRYVERRLNG